MRKSINGTFGWIVPIMDSGVFDVDSVKGGGITAFGNYHDLGMLMAMGGNYVWNP